MMNPLRAAFGVLSALALASAGCEDLERSRPLTDTLGLETSIVSSVGEAASQTADAPVERPEPIEVYRDLTVFDWYRRGEPLLFEGRRYLPEGRPLAVPSGELRPAEAFGGVTFYVRERDEPPHTTIYVPVFEGYWQPFRAEAEAPVPSG